MVTAVGGAAACQMSTDILATVEHRVRTFPNLVRVMAGVGLTWMEERCCPEEQKEGCGVRRAEGPLLLVAR